MRELDRILSTKYFLIYIRLIVHTKLYLTYLKVYIMYKINIWKTCYITSLF